MRYLLALSLMFFYACGPTALIDYEKGVDWENEKSYQFYTEMKSGLSELDEARVEKAIDSVLQQKGFNKTNNYHYFVSYYVDEVVSAPSTSVGVGLGAEGNNGGISGGVGIPVGRQRILQRFTLEIRNAYDKEKLLWQGVMEDNYKENASPLQKEAYYYKMISEILETFPPQDE